MRVYEYYSNLSEAAMFEWSKETPTVFNFTKRGHYAFFQRIKFKQIDQCTFEEHIRLGKIVDLQKQQFKKPRSRR